MSHTKVIRSDVLGYCMGVRRAVNTALKAVEDASSDLKITDKLDTYSERHEKVKTLGPLIHNRIALEQLKRRGLGQIEANDIDSVSVEKDPIVILRAHGVPPVTKRILKEKGCKVIDATCPRVLSSQKRAASYAAKGFSVILAGDKNHGEIISISGYAEEQGQPCYVIENKNDAELLLQKHFSDENTRKQPVVLIAQTTFSPEEYEAISAVLRVALSHIKILNTICSATYERQQALEDLCRKVDGIVVIGGKNSANTRRLYINAKRWMSERTDILQDFVVHIEQASEIPEKFFSLKTVGITAGASTPDELIDEVEKAFN
ncbi:MAG: 4-hydroxy-3-methylbut-2-enyl diphosphate reductase [Treponema sp. CETP13]|nr:MAG: 4-hydroxy-3-methylbut-2-enyl diphosphate reductase [Treponema sp. CETP13]